MCRRIVGEFQPYLIILRVGFLVNNYSRGWGNIFSPAPTERVNAGLDPDVAIRGRRVGTRRTPTNLPNLGCDQPKKGLGRLPQEPVEKLWKSCGKLSARWKSVTKGMSDGKLFCPKDLGR